MQRLTQEGLLVSHRNRGLFVADLTPEAVEDMYPDDNPIPMIVKSGAAGNMRQIWTLAGMKGVKHIDRERRRVTASAGTTINELVKVLAEHDDVDALWAFGSAGASAMSWSSVSTTTFSRACATSCRVGSLAISRPWLMIAMRSQSCSASSR